MLGPGAAARGVALGLVDEAPPRILVRVDEFPCATRLDARLGKFGAGPVRLFHELMLKHGVSYLMGIVPRPVDEPLDHRGTDRGGFRDGERELVERMRDDGIALAQHGTTHRTRYASPRRRSEYCGLPSDELAASLDEGRALLDELGIESEILIPPFNRFDARQWPVLASRYRVVAGGPESIRLVGLQPSPLWIGDAVYLASYRPLYGDAVTIRAAIDNVIAAAPGCWISIVLHAAWEIADGLRGLGRLLERIAPYTASWAEFLGAVERSRGSTARARPRTGFGASNLMRGRPHSFRDRRCDRRRVERRGEFRGALRLDVHDRQEVGARHRGHGAVRRRAQRRPQYDARAAGGRVARRAPRPGRMGDRDAAESPR